MQRNPVASDNLKAIGYDQTAKILEIEFLDGSIYQYFDVSLTIYAGLMKAISHGQFIDTFIKKAGYHSRQVR